MASPTFHLHLWPDRLLLAGPAFETGLHRHHAAQYCAGLDAPLRLRGGAGAPWQRAPAFYIPPNTPHEFAAETGRVVLLYLEAHSHACRSACRRHGVARPAALCIADPAPLRALADGRQDAGTVAAACAMLLGLPLPAAHPSDAALAEPDPRLQRALRFIDAQPPEHLPTLAEAARAAHASTSWLSHHFARAMGLPLRRYLLWRRLRLALETALDGATLTAAAHAGGFADSAHLTRTFRATFGVAPSFLFAARDRLVLHRWERISPPATVA